MIVESAIGHRRVVGHMKRKRLSRRPLAGLVQHLQAN
jgi:hypothetical protein